MSLRKEINFEFDICQHLAAHLRDQLDERGTLDVLRQGIELQDARCTVPGFTGVTNQIDVRAAAVS